MILMNVAKLNNQCIAKNWFECIEHFESYECSKAYGIRVRIIYSLVFMNLSKACPSLSRFIPKKCLEDNS